MCSKIEDINLFDNVVLYNIINKWYIIPLDTCLTHPVIYDGILKITIVVCPITLRSVVFDGQYTLQPYDKYNMMLKNSNNITIRIDTNIQNRHEVKILTLKNALYVAPDAIFAHVQLNNPQKIIGKDYYKNTKDITGTQLDGIIHPKTLVYVIFYESNNNTEKTSIIIGKDMSKDNATGYDDKKSKLLCYLNKNRSKIINKEGFVMPMLWYVAKIMYDESKIVYVYE